MSVAWNIPLDLFPFHKLVMEMFDCDNLMMLHEKAPQEYAMAEAGFDQGTYFHRHFYECIEKSPAFLNMYREFVHETLARTDSWSDEFVYQRIPTFRVHLPNNKAVGGRSHKDADYNHPIGEMNYLVPLTPMEGTSSVFIESQPGLKDFHFITLRPGQMWQFDGNQCEHGNLPNVTGWTRVSFDFRIISKVDLERSNAGRSISHGMRFVEGEYYEAFRYH